MTSASCTLRLFSHGSLGLDDERSALTGSLAVSQAQGLALSARCGCHALDDVSSAVRSYGVK